MKNIVTIIFCAMITSILHAQTPTDGFMMKPGQICVALGYEHESWTKYWETTLLRDNGNIGTLTTQSSQNMVALGLAPKVNIIAALPYIATSASAGTMAGHKGLQDASLWLKYQPLERKLGKIVLKTMLSAGISTPSSNYSPDFLPFSIGLGSTVGTVNGIVQLDLPKGLYATLQGGYHYRSNVMLERDYYYTNTEGGFYTNEVKMPNVADAALMLGWVRKTLRVELGYSMMNTLGGSDIRRQSMPFVANQMDVQKVGGMFQYRVPAMPILGFTGNVGYVVAGRNVGQTLSFGGGLLIQFQAWTPKSK